MPVVLGCQRTSLQFGRSLELHLPAMANLPEHAYFRFHTVADLGFAGAGSLRRVCWTSKSGVVLHEQVRRKPGDWRAVVRVVAFLLFVTGAGFVLHHVYQRYVLLRYIDEARLHYLHVQPLDDRPLLPRILHQQLPPALASWFLATPREIHFSPDAGDESDNSECMNWIDEYPLKSTVRRCSLGSALPRNHVIPMLRSLARWPRVEQVGFDGSSILKKISHVTILPNWTWFLPSWRNSDTHSYP